MPYLVALKNVPYQISLKDEAISEDEFVSGYFLTAPHLLAVNTTGERMIIATSEIAFIVQVTAEKFADMKEREKAMKEAMNARPAEIARPNFFIPPRKSQ
jgi:hypothetical protein